MFELLLVSQSPRRRDLLTEAGYVFRSDTVKVSEIIDENVNLPEAISKLARSKAQAYLDFYKGLNLKGILLLSADTVVALDGQVLGKPQDTEEACQFLRRLSGREHEVMTGISLICPDDGREYQGTEISWVRFRDLSDADIRNYVATGEPMDKAGAYGIQGQGSALVSEFRGSWSNIVGLPMEHLTRALAENGWRVRRCDHKT
jgi:septum formation protein